MVRGRVNLPDWETAAKQHTAQLADLILETYMRFSAIIELVFDER